MFVGQAYEACGSFPECSSLFCPAWWRALMFSVWVAPSNLPLRTTSLKGPHPHPHNPTSWARGGPSVALPEAQGLVRITNLRGANQVSSLGIEAQDEGSKVVLMVLQVTNLKFWQTSWGQGEATLNTSCLKLTSQ